METSKANTINVHVVFHLLHFKFMRFIGLQLLGVLFWNYLFNNLNAHVSITLCNSKLAIETHYPQTFRTLKAEYFSVPINTNSALLQLCIFSFIYNIKCFSYSIESSWLYHSWNCINIGIIASICIFFDWFFDSLQPIKSTNFAKLS